MKKFSVLALIFILIGCVQNQNSQDSSEIENLVLLNVGNFWDYKLEDRDVLRDVVKSKEVIENQDVYFLETDMGTWTASKAIYNTLNGYYVTRLEADLNNPMYHFKYPVKVGDIWESTFSFYGGLGHSNKYECLSKEAKVDVPAGSFRCILYEVEMHTQAGDYISHYYFKPGIGLVAVKNVTKDTSGKKGKWERKLKSYYFVE